MVVFFTIDCKKIINGSFLKSCFLIAVFAFEVLFSEENNEFLPLEKQEKSSAKFSVITYVQSYAIFPGVGVSFRGQKECWGAQLDVNMANTSLFGTSYDYEISIAALYYPLARNRMGGLYLSGGLGAHLNTPHANYGIRPCSPLFLGYEAKWIDLSVGVDLVYWVPYSNYYERYMFFVTDIVPSVKLGLSF